MLEHLQRVGQVTNLIHHSDIRALASPVNIDPYTDYDHRAHNDRQVKPDALNVGQHRCIVPKSKNRYYGYVIVSIYNVSSKPERKNFRHM